MLELSPKPTGISQNRETRDSKQPRRLLLALVLLLIAFAAVVVKDRDFWFGADDSADADLAGPEIPRREAVEPIPATTDQAAPAPVAHKQLSARASAKPKVDEQKETEAKADEQKMNGNTVVARTVLPPLDVEVVAGDNHRTIHPGSNTTKVEITHSGSFVLPATNAAEREPLSTASAVPQTSYPLLAQHMNVQGSVILQALIGADGIIENLHVTSGPAILAAAAQQAVREWKFKPVLQNGQAVETKAQITVNFTIRVADSSKDQIATSMPLRYSYTSERASR